VNHDLPKKHPKAACSELTEDYIQPKWFKKGKRVNANCHFSGNTSLPNVSLLTMQTDKKLITNVRKD
jgi:hypothetical protein